MKAPIRFAIQVPLDSADEIESFEALVADLGSAPTITGNAKLKLRAGSNLKPLVAANAVATILTACGALEPGAKIEVDARTDDRLESNGLVVEISGATSPEAAGAEAILLNLSTWFVNRETSHAVA